MATKNKKSLSVWVYEYECTGIRLIGVGTKAVSDKALGIGLMQNVESWLKENETGNI